MFFMDGCFLKFMMEDIEGKQTSSLGWATAMIIPLEEYTMQTSGMEDEILDSIRHKSKSPES